MKCLQPKFNPRIQHLQTKVVQESQTPICNLEMPSTLNLMLMSNQSLMSILPGKEILSDCLRMPSTFKLMLMSNRPLLPRLQLKEVFKMLHKMTF